MQNYRDDKFWEKVEERAIELTAELKTSRSDRRRRVKRYIGYLKRSKTPFGKFESVLDEEGIAEVIRDCLLNKFEDRHIVAAINKPGQGTDYGQLRVLTEGDRKKWNASFSESEFDVNEIVKSLEEKYDHVNPRNKISDLYVLKGSIKDVIPLVHEFDKLNNTIFEDIQKEQKEVAELGLVCNYPLVVEQYMEWLEAMFAELILAVVDNVYFYCKANEEECSKKVSCLLDLYKKIIESETKSVKRIIENNNFGQIKMVNYNNESDNNMLCKRLVCLELEIMDRYTIKDDVEEALISQMKDIKKFYYPDEFFEAVKNEATLKESDFIKICTGSTKPNGNEYIKYEKAKKFIEEWNKDEGRVKISEDFEGLYMVYSELFTNNGAMKNVKQPRTAAEEFLESNEERKEILDKDYVLVNMSLYRALYRKKNMPEIFIKVTELMQHYRKLLLVRFESLGVLEEKVVLEQMYCLGKMMLAQAFCVFQGG